MGIDLHTHSTASDGTDSPAELMLAARAAGLDVIAITDHDTTAGWDEARRALPGGLTLVQGAEFSCFSQPTGEPRTTLHILAYLFAPDDPALAVERQRLRESRRERTRRMVELMAADGLVVSWEQVRELAAGGSVGRPHIARALVDSGAVRTVSEAFERYLHNDGRYYLSKDDIDVGVAVRLVRAAGGVPVFAHPLARRRGRVVGDEVIAGLAEAGLAGLEVDHPDHDMADRAHLAGLARELGLIRTGSSDYHGANKTIALGACRTEPAAYEALVAQATSGVPITGQ